MASTEKDKIFEALEEQTICQINTNHLICPISQEIIRNPVKASDGHTYDRTSLRKYIETLMQAQQPIISALTREQLRPFNSAELNGIEQYMIPDYELKAIINNACKIKQASQNAAEYLYKDSSSDGEKNTLLEYFYEDPEESVNMKPPSSPTNSDIEEEPSEELASPVPNSSESEHQSFDYGRNNFFTEYQSRDYGRNRFFTEHCIGNTIITSAATSALCVFTGGVVQSIYLNPALMGPVIAGGATGAVCTFFSTAAIVSSTLLKAADLEAQYLQNQIDNAPSPSALDMVEENLHHAQGELIVPQNANTMLVSETTPEGNSDANDPNAALIPSQADPSEEAFRLSRYFGC